MKRASTGLAAALVAALCASAHAADSAGASDARSRRDPFAMPAAFRTPLAADASSAKPVAEPAWSPQLRGVMVAGRRSMADIEGVMVMLGDSVDGWRLIKVGEREAVFISKGREITLQLAPQREPHR